MYRMYCIYITFVTFISHASSNQSMCDVPSGLCPRLEIIIINISVTNSGTVKKNDCKNDR